MGGRGRGAGEGGERGCRRRGRRAWGEEVEERERKKKFFWFGEVCKSDRLVMRRGCGRGWMDMDMYGNEWGRLLCFFCVFFCFFWGV